MRTKDHTYLAKLGFADQDKRNPLHDAACAYLAQPEKVEKLSTLVHRDWLQKAHDGFDGYSGPEDEERFWKQILRNGMGTTELRRHLSLNGASRLGQRVTFSTQNVFVTYSQALLSTPLIKGEGQYKTVVGFLDVLIQSCRGKTAEARRTIMSKDGYDFRASWVDHGADLLNEDDVTWVAKRYVAKKINTLSEEECWTEQRNDRHLFPIVVEVKAGKTALSDVLQQISLYREYLDGFYVLCTLYGLSSSEKELLRQHGILHIYLDPREVQLFQESMNSVATEASF